MVDTVYLTTHEYSLRKDHKFIPNTKVKRDGQVLARLECNLFDKDFDKSGINQHGGLTVQQNTQTLYYNTSLPKLLYGHSLREVTPADLDRCIDTIRNQMVFAGLDVTADQIAQMTVSRIDYCRNIQIDHSIADYLYLLSTGQMQRMVTDHKRERGSLLFKNGVCQFAIYDKVRELLADKKQRIAAGVAADIPHNRLRFESRTFKSKNVQKLTGRQTLAECFDLKIARARLLSDFDKLRIDNQMIDTMNGFELGYLFANYSRVQVEKYIAAQVILRAVDNDFVLLAQYLSARYKPRHVRNLINYYRSVCDRMRDRSKRDLLAELRYKLAA